MNINNLGIMQGRLVPREIKTKLQSFPWKNWKKEIIIAKKNKIKNLEWTLDYKNFEKNPIISNPKKTKTFLTKNSVRLKSLTADFFMQKPPFRNKNNTTNYLIKLISIAKKINLELIIIPLVDNSSIKKFEDKKIIIEYFKMIQKKIKFNQLKIIFELDLPPLQVSKFISFFDNSFGINYDMGNSAFYRFKFSEEKKYFSRVYNIHLKDRNKDGNSVPFGEGLVKFEQIFKFLNQIKYKNQLILQSYIPINAQLVASNTLKNFNFVKKFL